VPLAKALKARAAASESFATKQGFAMLKGSAARRRVFDPWQAFVSLFHAGGAQKCMEHRLLLTDRWRRAQLRDHGPPSHSKTVRS
jgi:hypothetical protein